MRQISLIAAIDENNGLGNNQKLLCYLPADLKHFKELTLGKTIVMGRKTFESIGRILPNRRNIIISRQQLNIPGAEVMHSLDEVLKKTKSELMIIGGADLFKETINIADNLYITHIHHVFIADVFFPLIDHSVWQELSSTFRSKDDLNVFDVTFSLYERKINAKKFKKRLTIS